MLKAKSLSLNLTRLGGRGYPDALFTDEEMKAQRGEVACPRSHSSPVACLVAQSCPTLCDPMDCSPSGSSVHGISPGKREYWNGLPLPSPRDCPHPGTEAAFPTPAGEFLTNEPPGKPQQSINTKGQIKIFSGIQVMMEASKSTFLNYKLGRQLH